MELTDEQFDALITRAMNDLPQQYIKNLDNVAVVMADEPTPEQLTHQGVRQGQLLLGLYEGVPLTQRGAGYQFVLPDKITLFKHPLVLISQSNEELQANIQRTLWHEIAHHYGMNHSDINRVEKRR